LSCGDAGGFFNLVGIGKTLADRGITSEEPPTFCRLSQQVPAAMM
jgi:hypothetical protein